MQCTSCKRQIKPVIALDIDGTLGDYHWHFTEFACKYWNLQVPMNRWDGKGEFEEFLGITKVEYREAKMAYRQGGLKRWLPIFPETKPLVEDIKRLNVELWIATTRPWQQISNIDPDTREWLKRNEIKVDGLLYGDDKYSQLEDAVGRDRVIGVVDDLPSQIYEARAHGFPAFLVQGAHNSQISEMFNPRGNLVAARRWLVSQIGSWYANTRRI